MHNGRQSYRCCQCHHSFQNAQRRTRSAAILWNQYAHRKQTYAELAKSHNTSIKSIQRKLDSHHFIPVPIAPRHVMVVMDTTYFKRICIVLLLRDAYTAKNLLYRFILYETINEYVLAIAELKQSRFVIDGIVVDGRRGIFRAFPEYPIQMCQFHQKQIVRRYLTSNPHTEAGIELKNLIDVLTHTDKPSFTFFLALWHLQYASFLKERTIHPDMKHWSYTHKRVRSAYRSLITNLPYLFTYQTVKGMPNTTNSIDGFFAHLKDKVRLHRGLRLKRKKRLIRYLIERKSSV